MDILKTAQEGYDWLDAHQPKSFHEAVARLENAWTAAMTPLPDSGAPRIATDLSLLTGGPALEMEGKAGDSWAMTATALLKKTADALDPDKLSGAERSKLSPSDISNAKLASLALNKAVDDMLNYSTSRPGLIDQATVMVNAAGAAMRDMSLSSTGPTASVIETTITNMEMGLDAARKWPPSPGLTGPTALAP